MRWRGRNARTLGRASARRRLCFDSDSFDSGIETTPRQNLLLSPDIKPSRNYARDAACSSVSACDSRVYKADDLNAAGDPTFVPDTYFDEVLSSEKHEADNSGGTPTLCRHKTTLPTWESLRSYQSIYGHVILYLSLIAFCLGIVYLCKY